MKKIQLGLLAVMMMAGLSLKAQQNGNQAKFRIALNGGYSYRLAKIADDVPADLRNT